MFNIIYNVSHSLEDWSFKYKVSKGASPHSWTEKNGTP